ncbi:MAG: hypothetical protein R2747_12255 [Pyrinomonadaceae bacterium]
MRKAIVNFWNEKQGTILQILLGGMIVVFLSILIGVYLIARQANPILLDEKGNPKNPQTQSQKH